MKMSPLLSLLVAGILLSGCASHRQKPITPAPVASKTIVTPDASLAAKVVQYNSIGRYVVLSFPAGKLPKAGDNLYIYHNGLKVAEVKTDTWQLNSYVVADLVTGDAQIGDEVRDQ
jgi:hypothetical protein